MVKAIIFDCFGVLTSDGWLPFKEKHFKNDQEKYDEATKLNALANGNKISYGSFLSQVAELANVSVDELNSSMHRSVSNTPVFDVIRELKKNYKIGFLSNVSGDWLQELFTDEQRGMFDAMTLSSEIGHVKPDPMAYVIAAEQLGLKPEECLFIDDQQRLIDGAKATGMHTILYESIDQVKRDLKSVLEMANSDE